MEFRDTVYTNAISSIFSKMQQKNKIKICDLLIVIFIYLHKNVKKRFSVTNLILFCKNLFFFFNKINVEYL